MTAQENKELYRRFIETVFNAGNFDNIHDFLSADYSIQDAPPGTAPGAEGVKDVVRMFRGGFPDLHITLEEVIAEGDLVSARSTMRGTHQGEIFGIPATGNKVSVPGLTMVRIVNGRLVASWVKNDVGALMQQLDAPAA